MLEGREVVIYTDHKPLIFAFTRKHNNSSRQIRYLEFISQIDIRYIAGSDNVVADTFSRISEITLLNFNNFRGLAEDQFSDQELQSLMGSGTGLELRPMLFASSEELFFMYSWAPYVTKPFGRQMFNSIHNLSHPGVKDTQKLVSARFAWKNINKDYALWCKKLHPVPKIQSYTSHKVNCGQLCFTICAFFACAYRSGWTAQPSSKNDLVIDLC
ncbi:hypothetical protein AVEN_81354-1 [Araneus ventricosus]|uniref:Uncharacterized protein n=1 Tax=Araneus ventricosus TaxID=182803 RepID=A0A4Y2B8U2_ARAVE|nr:hypothetical protein AVEN_81354-1 [Araneus ventricosus]